MTDRNVIDRLTAENERLRCQGDALKAVIEHVGADGKVPMAYILSAQTALHGAPEPTKQCIGCLVDTQPHSCGYDPAVIPRSWLGVIGVESHHRRINGDQRVEEM